MDVVNEIEVLETDVKDCNEKCQRVNCSAIYDAIMSSFKLIYDSVPIINIVLFPFFFYIHYIKIRKKCLKISLIYKNNLKYLKINFYSIL